MNIFRLTTLFSFFLLLTACDNYKSVNLIKNPSFEDIKEKQAKVAKGWFSSQHAGQIAYKLLVDPTVANTGKNSFQVHQYKDQDYGMVRQIVPLPKRENKKFVFSAMLKSKDILAGEGWRLVVNCKAEDGYINKQYQSEPISGTTDWTKITVEGIIPEDTVKLEVGALLQSFGTGWVDDVNLRIDPPQE